MKMREVGAELFHVDKQMYRHDKFSVAFHNFLNMPKNYYYMTAVHEITILNESLKNALEIWN